MTGMILQLQCPCWEIKAGPGSQHSPKSLPIHLDFYNRAEHASTSIIWKTLSTVLIDNMHSIEYSIY